MVDLEVYTQDLSFAPSLIIGRYWLGLRFEGGNARECNTPVSGSLC